MGAARMIINYYGECIIVDEELQDQYWEAYRRFKRARFPWKRARHIASSFSNRHCENYCGIKPPERGIVVASARRALAPPFLYFDQSEDALTPFDREMRGYRNLLWQRKRWKIGSEADCRAKAKACGYRVINFGSR